MIKSGILAAVAVGSFSTAASAATLHSGSYNVEITLLENYWDCSDFCGDMTPDIIPFKGLSIGQTVVGTISFLKTSPYNISLNMSWGDYSFANNRGFSEIDINSYWNPALDDYIKFSLIDGVFSGIYKRLPYSGEWNQNAVLEFSSVSVAPVPIPGSAALLPVGLGALALLRKRRRHIS